VHLASIAETARDVDFAMRWGFGMKQGPFELWQEAGWLQVAQWIQEDIDAGKALSKAPLPDWVFKGPVADAGGVHTPQGSWNPTTGKFEPRRVLPVHQRQLFPELCGAAGPRLRDRRPHAARGQDIRLWTLDERGADRQPQDQDARHQPGGVRRPAAGGRHWPRRTSRAW
jgi:3-hydroxyacyl-CoA dehydrogenase